jgi:hypothetical protein
MVKAIALKDAGFLPCAWRIAPGRILALALQRADGVRGWRRTL